MATDKIVSDIGGIIEQGRQQAYASANQVVVLTYWHIGRRIVEEEQHGEARARYGTRLMKTLAEQLMPKYGNAFSKRNLDYFRQFYLSFSNLEIVNACVHNLTWTHFRTIMQVADPKAESGTQKRRRNRCGVQEPLVAIFLHNIMAAGWLASGKGCHCLCRM